MDICVYFRLCTCYASVCVCACSCDCKIFWGEPISCVSVGCCFRWKAAAIFGDADHQDKVPKVMQTPTLEKESACSTHIDFSSSLHLLVMSLFFYWLSWNNARPTVTAVSTVPVSDSSSILSEISRVKSFPVTEALINNRFTPVLPEGNI